MRNALILLFSSLCALNIVAGILPPNTAPGGAVSEKLAPLRTSLGILQQWQMFETIPVHADFEMWIVARDSTGRERRFGPELPGFGELEVRRRSRSYYTFARMFDSEPELRDAYLAKVAAALREQDPTLVEFRVEVELHYLRHLFHARRDGVLIKVVPSVFGPFQIADEIAR